MFKWYVLKKNAYEISEKDPKANTAFYELGLRMLRDRCFSGERTQELYDEIMNFAE